MEQSFKQDGLKHPYSLVLSFVSFTHLNLQLLWINQSVGAPPYVTDCSKHETFRASHLNIAHGLQSQHLGSSSESHRFCAAGDTLYIDLGPHYTHQLSMGNLDNIAGRLGGIFGGIFGKDMDTGESTKQMLRPLRNSRRKEGKTVK
ncbi:Uncharacterized protein Fot_23868 [Forsythia ovata]|uniref:Uncharacterized protein n=1 Tax=Forsythia ovata TaxID=205694 RepID=A0ABD1U4K2_9LAMI